MASTRNKNTPGDYQLEQWAQQRRFEDITFINATQGRPVQPLFPGNGLCGARIAGKDLAQNDSDIESFLFGIGSTNLDWPWAGPKLCLKVCPPSPTRAAFGR